MITGMHLARQNLAPTGALHFEKCARDFLSAPTDIYPKVRAIYQANSDFNYLSHGDSLQSDFNPSFAPNYFL